MKVIISYLKMWKTGNSATVAFMLIVMILFISSCKTKVEENQSIDVPTSNNLKLSEAQIQLANITFSEARIGEIGQDLSLTGVLKIDKQSIVSVSSRVPGRIEKLYFRNTGETVKKGDKLYDFYSEDLISAQREYLRLQSNNWNFTGKYEPSLVLEDRLLVLGMTSSQIDELEKGGKILFTVSILSPVAGKIKSVNVSEGQYVSEGESMFVLADDNNLWVEAQVYPDEIKLLKTGMQAIVLVPSAGVPPVRCKISFINPSFETGKNITLVRAVIDNSENMLHPGMFAIMRIRTQDTRGIVVPSSAVIRDSGGDKVWVRNENGDFSPRIVTTGLTTADSVLILSGITPWETVVATGSYLLTSELILKQGSDLTSDPVMAAGKIKTNEKETAEL